MKKIRIIITMTCLMLCLMTSAQDFIVPAPPPKPKPPIIINNSHHNNRGKGKGNEKENKNKNKPIEDPTTGTQVEGIERSFSIEDLETLANEGDIAAHAQLGMYYYKLDDQKALPHLIAGAEAGNPLAQYCLGRVYYTGKFNVEVDTIKATTYYLLSAQQNCAPAQYAIAVCLYNGDGVEQNREAARRWMEKAAQNNYADAKEYLETHSFE